MDVERFARLVRSLSASPSRRAVGHALLGITVGSFLAPVIDSVSGLAKKKRKRRKKNRKKKELCLESHNGTCHKCAPQDEYCSINDYGIVPRCCSFAKRELCTSCGCCPEDFTLCCVSERAKTCCHKDGECCGFDQCCLPGETCCSGTSNGFNHLCYDPSKEECCGEAEAGIAGACPQGTFCGPKPGGLPFCCPTGGTVCGDGCCEQGSFCCGDGVCCNNAACKPEPEGHCWAGPSGTPARIQ